MDIKIEYVPRSITQSELKARLAKILHDQTIFPNFTGRDTNFKVTLPAHESFHGQHKGHGYLTIPDERLGNQFLGYCRSSPIKIGGKKLRFTRKPNDPEKSGEHRRLLKTVYVDPEVLEEEKRIVTQLDREFHIDEIQFGVFYHDKPYPSSQIRQVPFDRSIKQPPVLYSIEWEEKRRSAKLTFDYKDRSIQLQLGDQSSESFGHRVTIKFDNLNRIFLGYDFGNPYFCFDTYLPLIVETFQFFGKQDRERKTSLQGPVSSYAHILRVLPHPEPGRDVVREFRSFCHITKLSEKLFGNGQDVELRDASKQSFFNSPTMSNVTKIFATYPFPVAFQLESLIRNGLMTTNDLKQLITFIKLKDICKRHPEHECQYAAGLLQDYRVKLLASSQPSLADLADPAARAGVDQSAQSRIPTHRECLEAVLKNYQAQKDFVSSSSFLCHHITVTPSRFILRGPYPTMSNRIIRRFKGFEHHFIRVDFSDEDNDRLALGREVNNRPYLHTRVGAVLTTGFSLGARHFELLGYSSSSIRNKSVWFINPFDHPKYGRVDGTSIRRSIIDYSGKSLSEEKRERNDVLLTQPSKYAARIALAFTSTECSVKIHRSEWKEISDLGTDPYLHTDGAGTMSTALRDRVWIEMCREDPERMIREMPPSVIQIRFLGYKGILTIDAGLDKESSGIHMCLRPSMRKYESSDEEEELADIEVADVFNRPQYPYLYRALVMSLEDRGVPYEAFEKLQREAERDARTIHDSITRFESTTRAHRLGNQFGLSDTLARLEALGFDITAKAGKPLADSKFLGQLRFTCLLSILYEIKDHARIKIPDSYFLVGTVDEGPAYEERGIENVWKIPYDHVCICIQESPDKEPTWLEGPCSISRSPVCHPGDVQRIRAIKPPLGPDVFCSFIHVRNAVVFPSVGRRSLPSCLGGGDLDGDPYYIIQNPDLLPVQHVKPAAYRPIKPFQLDQKCNINDVCDFIVEYFHSDMIGLLSDRLLEIADESKEGMNDEKCIELAELCSQAVDYAKHGVPIAKDVRDLPKSSEDLKGLKPDWKGAHLPNGRPHEFYESDRALGRLYRALVLDKDCAPKPVDSDVSRIIQPLVENHVDLKATPFDKNTIERDIFAGYANVLRSMSLIYGDEHSATTGISEAEIVAGVILQRRSQRSWKREKLANMHLHARNLVRDVQKQFLDASGSGNINDRIKSYLGVCWSAWEVSERLAKSDTFGAGSFGLIALGEILQCLEVLDAGDVGDMPKDENNVPQKRESTKRRKFLSRFHDSRV